MKHLNTQDMFESGHFVNFVILDFNGLSFHFFWVSTSKSPLLLKGFPPWISGKINFLFHFCEERLHLRKKGLCHEGCIAMVINLGYKVPILADYRFDVNDVYSKVGEMQCFPPNQPP